MVYGAIICVGLSGFVAFGNISGCISAARWKSKGIDRGFSCVPFFSLIFSLLAWLLGRTTIGLWAFLPAVVDPGTWMLVALPGVLIAIYRDKANNTAPKG